MKNNILTIMKKELSRFFGDKRMVFTTVLMPGLMIYILYSLMGSGIMKNMMGDEEYVAKAYIQNLPEELSEAFGDLAVTWTEVTGEADLEQVKLEIQNKAADVLVIFPEDFTDAVAHYDVASGGEAPNVEIYYNSAETESYNLYRTLTETLDVYEASMANKLDVNAGDIVYDCASERDMTGKLFSMMIPMLLMIFLYSGCIAVAPESIAGEKERGTIATLLVTPMKRSDLALGKVFSLSIIALLSGISSFIGTFLSLPKMMDTEMLNLDSSVYVATDYALLLGIILTTVLVMISAIAVISALARSVKEAGTAVSPLMLLIMFISFIPLFGGDSAAKLYHFCIPLYNSVKSMQGIFAFSYEPVQIVMTMAVNVLAAGILSFVLTKLFDSEKVMFAK